MGKINSRMRKVRENTPNTPEPISQEVIHEHEWTFIRELELVDRTPYKAARFLCHCGAYKQPKLKEVEE